jgi:hypothetical protein
MAREDVEDPRRELRVGTVVERERHHGQLRVDLEHDVRHPQRQQPDQDARDHQATA